MKQNRQAIFSVAFAAFVFVLVIVMAVVTNQTNLSINDASAAASTPMAGKNKFLPDDGLGGGSPPAPAPSVAKALEKQKKVAEKPAPVTHSPTPSTGKPTGTPQAPNPAKTPRPTNQPNPTPAGTPSQTGGTPAPANNNGRDGKKTTITNGAICRDADGCICSGEGQLSNGAACRTSGAGGSGNQGATPTNTGDGRRTNITTYAGTCNDVDGCTCGGSNIVKGQPCFNITQRVTPEASGDGKKTSIAVGTICRDPDGCNCAGIGGVATNGACQADTPSQGNTSDRKKTALNLGTMCRDVDGCTCKGINLTVGQTCQQSGAQSAAATALIGIGGIALGITPNPINSGTCTAATCICLPTGMFLTKGGNCSATNDGRRTAIGPASVCRDADGCTCSGRDISNGSTCPAAPPSTSNGDGRRTELKYGQICSDVDGCTCGGDQLAPRAACQDASVRPPVTVNCPASTCNPEKDDKKCISGRTVSCRPRSPLCPNSYAYLAERTTCTIPGGNPTTTPPSSEITIPPMPECRTGTVKIARDQCFLTRSRIDASTVCCAKTWAQAAQDLYNGNTGAPTQEVIKNFYCPTPAQVPGTAESCAGQIPGFKPINSCVCTKYGANDAGKIPNSCACVTQ